MAKTRIGAPLVFSNGPGETSWLQDLPVHGNPNYAVYYNDFFTAQNYNTTNEFNQVKDAGAAVAIAADAASGQVTLTSTATTNNDGAYIGLNQENFSLQTNKKVWMSALVKGSLCTAQAMFIGLGAATATAPLNGVADTTARVGFELILATTNTVQVKTSDGTTASAVSSGVTMSDNTLTKFDLVWDGAGSVSFYINDIFITQKTTNLPAAAVNLTPAFMSVSRSASGTRTGSLDYFMVVAER